MPPESFDTQPEHLPLFSVTGSRLYEDDRVAGVYDDQVIGATLTYQNPRFVGVPHLIFDLPTQKRGVTGLRILHQGVANDMNLTLIHRPDSSYASQSSSAMSPVNSMVEPADHAQGSKQGQPEETKAQSRPQPEFLLKVSDVHDTEEGMSITVVGKDGYHKLGSTRASFTSKDRSLFDGLGPGDRVLLRLTPVEWLPSQDPSSHELSE